MEKSFHDDVDLLVKELENVRKVGYARVSTDEQKMDMQLDELKKFGCKPIWEDYGSATRKKRRGLSLALLDVEEGDAFVVWKLDRLARRVRDIMDITDQLEDKGVHFVSIRDGIDTTSAAGRMMFNMLSVMAEFERDQIAERTRAGMRAAKRRGKRVGPEAKMTEAMVADAQHLRDTGSTAKQIAERLHERYKVKVSEKTVYNYTTKPGSKRRPARKLVKE